MTDEIDVTGHSSAQRIDMTRDVDVAYWCRLFDVDHSQLRRAVQQVGPQAPAVLRYLRRAEVPPAVLTPVVEEAPRVTAG